MKNESLQKILDNIHKKSNKDLANMLLTLNHDFDNIKNVILDLTESLGEIEMTHKSVYSELEKRLKGNNTKTS